MSQVKFQLKSNSCNQSTISQITVANKSSEYPPSVERKKGDLLNQNVQSKPTCAPHDA